jgi:hypothetical protein
MAFASQPRTGGPEWLAPGEYVSSLRGRDGPAAGRGVTAGIIDPKKLDHRDENEQTAGQELNEASGDRGPHYQQRPAGGRAEGDVLGEGILSCYFGRKAMAQQYSQGLVHVPLFVRGDLELPLTSRGADVISG